MPDTLTADGSATTLPPPGPNSVQPNGYAYAQVGYAVLPGQDELAILYSGSKPNDPPDLVVTAYTLQGGALFEKSFTGTPLPSGSQYSYAGASSGVITALDDGNLVVGDITYAYPNYPVEFSILSPSGAVVATGSDPAPAGYNVQFNLAVATLPGGFELSSDAEKSGSAVMTRVSRLVSDSGAYGVVETDQTDTHLPPTSFAQNAKGDYVTIDDNYFRYGTAQTSQGTVLPNEPADAVASNAAAVLTNGLAIAGWVDSGAVHVAVYDPGDGAFRPAVTVDWSGASDVHVVALPDDGYVVSWMKDGAYKGEVFSADGAPGGVIPLAGDVAGIDSHGDLYTVGAKANQYQVQTYAISGSGSDGGGSSGGSNSGGSSNGGETFAAAETVTLAGSPNWTAAAMLSSHSLALVGVANGAYGSHFAVEQSYDSSGAQTSSHALMGYAGPGQTLVPGISALPVGGFYEATYAGSSDYEIYNANDQRVFVHNPYTSPTAAFAPLANGGYVTTDSASNVFGLFDANNANVGWYSLPSDAPGTPTVNALNGGGFVFTYAGTNHFDLYDASGDLLANGNFSATGSSFAQGFAPLAGNGNGFLQAWISPDGSTYNGLATSLDVQAMGPRGAISPAITVAQDLDPWHTQFNLQAHADGSVAILWSQGGAVFGAEYANGAAGPANGAGVLGGDLAHTVAIQLPNDTVGFAWLQNNEAWAEIFNPATGAVQRADLGGASGDISGVRALATDNGGMAVSWHTSLGTEGVILQANGQTSGDMALPGDLLGVNGAGQAVTVHDVNGMPAMQTYVLNDGLFWAA